MTEKNQQQEDSFLEYMTRFSALISASPAEGSELGERCFSLANGKTIFALVLAELPDSFIVTLPTYLVEDEGKVDGKLFVNKTAMRLFKSNVQFVMEPEPVHRFYYFRFIKKFAKNMTWFFTKSRMETLNVVLLAGIPQQQLTEPVEPRVHMNASPNSFLSIFESKERH